MANTPEMPEIRYRFASSQIFKVSAFAIALPLIALSAAVIITIRVLPFGLSPLACSLIASPWLLTAIAGIGSKMWFEFARGLKGIQSPQRTEISTYLIFMIGILILSDIVFFWQTDDVRFIIEHLMLAFLLLGGNAAATILVPYLEYRQSYTYHTITFLDYCNLPVSTKH